MKNLENFGVLELNVVETVNIDGGCLPFGICPALEDLGNNIGDAWDSFWGGFDAGKRD